MKNLRILRKRRKLTQQQLHMATLIDQSLLSKYEKGLRLPTCDNLIILADFFGTTMDYLMGREAPTNRPLFGNT